MGGLARNCRFQGFVVSGARKGAIDAVHLLLVRNGSVLLLRRANTGYEDGNYSVPAGHVEAGESATASMLREAAEEVGLELSATALRLALVMHRKAEEERIDFFFAVETWSGEPENREPEKCDEFRWAPMDALPANVIPYVRRAIEAFQTSETYVEFGWGKQDDSDIL